MSTHDPTTVLIARLNAFGSDPRPTGPDSWESRCPAHQGTRRNLSIKRGDDGRALLHCHAHGCSLQDILGKLEMAEADLFPPRDGHPTYRPHGNGKAPPKAKSKPPARPTPEAAIEATARKLGKPTAHWTYQEADGSEVARVYRFDPSGERKEYRPVHRTPDGWRIGDPDGPWPLYRLPELAGAGPVYLTEGEKAADLAAGLGLIATTSAHGAKAAHKSDWTPLAGREVVILPDHDSEGESYARAVVAELAKLEPSPTVRIVRLANLWRTSEPIPEGGDIEEWLADGVPDTWEPEACRAELERVAAATPPADLSDPPPAEPDRPRCKLTRAADIQVRPVEWLWDGRIPLGMLTLFAGDPKLGKSFVTTALAANVSRGAPNPGDDRSPAGPGSVVLMSAEDEPARTIVPRLKAAGADLSRVYILESVYLSDGTEALPSLRTDIEAIEQAITSADDCRLVVIDPVSAYLGGTDDHRNGELRGVLSPLKALAERHGIAVVLVTHLNKASGTNPRYRVTGSIAYVGACRANFLFARDKDDPTGRRVFMLANGCNLAPDPPTLAYRIEDRGDGPAVEWEAEAVAITVEAALQPADPVGDERRAEQAACKDWLRETLGSGRMLQTEVARAGKDAGFSHDQLNRAKRKIGAVTRREGFGSGARCYWELPETPAGSP